MSVDWPCLGFAALGHCAYDPGSPPIYFGLGDVVAALAFTLAAQQLLKPIFRFRLEARLLTIGRLYGAVFAGCAALIAAAVVPQLPFLRSSPVGYPILYELFGTALFAGAYGALVLSILTPVRARSAAMQRFARASGQLLSEASEVVHVEYGEDLARSLPNLIRTAQFGERRRTSAFFDFTFRHQLENAAWAGSLLQILADPQLCRSLVVRTPWRTARMIRQLGTEKLHASAAEPLLRELGWQAIVTPESMLSRETGYHGFATAGLLADSLFSDPFIIANYNPLDRFMFSRGLNLHDSELQARFKKAAKLALQTIIDDRGNSHSYAAWRISEFYENTAQALWTEREEALAKTSGLIFAAMDGARLAIEFAERLMASVSEEEYRAMYAETTDHEVRHDLLDPLVAIVVHTLSYASNEFADFNDRYWILVHDVFGRVFPEFGTQPDGMTPFQQRVAIRISRKLADNMKGYYPSISKILLATLGPYDRRAGPTNATAHKIIRDVVYSQLKGLRALAANERKIFSDFLPANVTFDPATNSLTHRFRFGEERITNLSRIRPRRLSLLPDHVFRPQRSVTLEEH